jgi:hypothetical protein
LRLGGDFTLKLTDLELLVAVDLHLLLKQLDLGPVVCHLRLQIHVLLHLLLQKLNLLLVIVGFKLVLTKKLVVVFFVLLDLSYQGRTTGLFNLELHYAVL